MSEQAQASNQAASQQNVGPQDPLHYAPRWLRERPEQQRLPAVGETRSAGETRQEAGQTIPFPAPLDTQLESAIYEPLRRGLEPKVMEEPPGLARELDRGNGLFGVTARFGAAIGVAAVMALLFVFMAPGSRQQDASSSFAATVQSMKAAVMPSRPAESNSKPELTEFKKLLTSGSNQGAKRDQSQQLLNDFVQWRQKDQLN